MLVVGLVAAPFYLTVAAVIVISEHDHRNIPVWIDWSSAIIFWGTVVTLLVRTVQNKRVDVPPSGVVPQGPPAMVATG